MKSEYQAGLEARYDGMTAEANPYPEDSSEYYSWEDGWSDAHYKETAEYDHEYGCGDSYCHICGENDEYEDDCYTDGEDEEDKED